MGDLEVVVGTGPLGLAVVRLLLTQGRSVRAVSRTGGASLPNEVEQVAGDIRDVAFAREASSGARAVFLCAKPPYQRMAADFKPIMDGVIEGAALARARLIYADNLYAYGPVDGVLTEDLPYAAQGAKGRARARLAEQLLGAHAEGRIQAAIGRASDFYGPGVLRSAVGERVFKYALVGMAASVTGDPDQLHTYTYIDDFAEGLITLGDQEAALGRVWHVPSAETVTTRRFLEMVFEALGEVPRIQAVPRWLISLAGLFDPVVRELPEILYQTERPFIVDHSRFEEAFGARVTPHATGIRRTLDWYLEKA